MKHILIFILICTSYILSNDTQFFKCKLELETGIIPAGHLVMYDTSPKSKYTKLNGFSYYIDQEIIFSIVEEHFFAGMGNKIYAWKQTKGITFRPDAIDFKFMAGIKMSDNFQVGFRHYCEHPIKAWSYESEPTIFERWYEEIYFKMDFVLK